MPSQVLWHMPEGFMYCGVGPHGGNTELVGLKR